MEVIRHLNQPRFKSAKRATSFAWSHPYSIKDVVGFIAASKCRVEVVLRTIEVTTAAMNWDNCCSDEATVRRHWELEGHLESMASLSKLLRLLAEHGVVVADVAAVATETICSE